MGLLVWTCACGGGGWGGAGPESAAGPSSLDRAPAARQDRRWTCGKQASRQAGRQAGRQGGRAAAHLRSAGSVVWAEQDSAKMPTACRMPQLARWCPGGGCCGMAARRGSSASRPSTRQTTRAVEMPPSSEKRLRRRRSMQSSGSSTTQLSAAARCCGCSGPMPAQGSKAKAGVARARRTRKTGVRWGRRPRRAGRPSGRTFAGQEQLQHLPGDHERDQRGPKQLAAAEDQHGGGAQAPRRRRTERGVGAWLAGRHEVECRTNELAAAAEQRHQHAQGAQRDPAALHQGKGHGQQAEADEDVDQVGARLHQGGALVRQADADAAGLAARHGNRERSPSAHVFEPIAMALSINGTEPLVRQVR
jgi:hypothetical protein